MSTTATAMTVKDISKRLSELFKENKWMQAQEELFSKDAESIEPAHVQAQGMPTAVKGLDKIKQKGEQFNSMVEKIHGGYTSEPIIAGNHIAFAMGLDVTMKGMGRKNMEEIIVYEVKDGMIVKEQFFF